MASYYGLITPAPLLASGVPGQAGGSCRLFVRLTDMTGKPLVGQTIIFYEPPNANIEGPSFEMTTNTQGYAELSLAVGKVVEVHFLGTSFMKRIEVPAVAVADLLQVADMEGFDAFTIVRPDPIPAIRRS